MQVKFIYELKVKRTTNTFMTQAESSYYKIENTQIFVANYTI